MSFPKIFVIGSVVLFSTIGITAILKKRAAEAAIVEKPIVVEKEIPRPKPPPQPKKVIEEPKQVSSGIELISINDVDPSESVDRVGELFATGPKRHPIVETITYTSRVSWLKGRPAWIADYASYYKTSKHFIARSLNRKADYFTQNVAPGDRFNVFRPDMNISFHLIADLARCKMWFYWVNDENGEHELLKVYRIGVGVHDRSMPSGTLTPIGKFKLGEKITTYKPGVMGFHRNERIEMINVFGTRWIPFSSDEGTERDYGIGYGIHGAPSYMDETSGELVEMRECIGKYDSDGCIRLMANDLEELYAIVVTRPTVIEIARDSKPVREELRMAQ